MFTEALAGMKDLLAIRTAPCESLLMELLLM
jgi:hypothetical protein